MTDEKCAYYKDGYCLKGLVGTKCEIEGCIAHADRLTIKNIEYEKYFTTEK